MFTYDDILAKLCSWRKISTAGTIAKSNIAYDGSGIGAFFGGIYSQRRQLK